MWSKWQDRFKTFGAKRVDFVISKQGGSAAGKTGTGAKCLMFFESDDVGDMRDIGKGSLLGKLVNKILCGDIIEVTILEQSDFEYQVRDSTTDDFYGTKFGHPILKFTPSDIPASKGRKKCIPAIVISRVFKLKKHRQRL